MISSRESIEAPATPVATASVTNAVVATLVVLFPAVCVVAVGFPVSAGEASGAKPEIDAPEGIVTVPVNVGEARFAFRSRAVCCAVDTGFAVSAVLSTEPKPTSPLTIPVGVLITGDVIVLFVKVADAARSVALDVLSTLPRPTSPFTIPVGVFTTGEVSVLFVKVCAVVKSAVTVVSIESVFPDFERPVLAVICPAPEN